MLLLIALWLSCVLVACVLIAYAARHPYRSGAGWIETNSINLAIWLIVWPLALMMGLAALPFVMMALILWVCGVVFPPLLEGLMSPVTQWQLRKAEEAARPKSRIPF